MKTYNVNLDLSLSELVDIECLIEYALPKLHKEIKDSDENEFEAVSHFAGMYSVGHRLWVELRDNRTNTTTHKGGE